MFRVLNTHTTTFSSAKGRIRALWLVCNSKLLTFDLRFVDNSHSIWYSATFQWHVFLLVATVATPKWHHQLPHNMRQRQRQRRRQRRQRRRRRVTKTFLIKRTKVQKVHLCRHIAAHETQALHSTYTTASTLGEAILFVRRQKLCVSRIKLLPYFFRCCRVHCFL